MDTNINIISATEARRDWSQLIDSVVHDKPRIINRTRDYVMVTDVHLMTDLLDVYKYKADKYVEEDNTVTLALEDMDLAVNGVNENDAKTKMAGEILEYADDFYNEYQYWSKAPNRRKHIPYIMKALLLHDINKIGEEIICQDGKI